MEYRTRYRLLLRKIAQYRQGASYMKHEIIELLKSSKGYLSGEEISRQFKISRAGIWKNIEELRRKGYRIEAVSHKGYKLKSTPDKLFPREIQFKLNTSII